MRLVSSFRFLAASAPSLVAAGLLLPAAPAVHAQQATPLAQDVSLRQLMSPEEFKGAGLKKLSPEELTRLENFLRGYREQTVQQVAKATEEKVNPPPKRDRATRQSVVEGKINGSFTGLKGRTRVVLKDGSVWQQANDSDKFFCNLNEPDVVLVRNVFGYKMYVTGAPRWFYARQVILQ